jgi:uncharacterized membrane protein YkvA (DUF1232 family)
MTTLDSRCLEAFPSWLKTLAEDAQGLAALLARPETPPGVRRVAAGALNYLFKSIDLIQDGLEDLGFIDDAFVLRVLAARLGESERATSDLLATLAEQAALIEEFLAADYVRLERYVQKLESGSARGRSVTQILEDDAICADLVREVAEWAAGYGAPSFARDTRSLVKLRSFLGARLPA